MKVHYIACARSSSVDAKTNQLSLFHILDEIAAPAFPLTLPSVCVASLSEREPADEDLQSYSLVVKRDGGLIASFTMNIDFSSTRRNRSVNLVQGLTIPGPGLVTIAMVQRGVVLAEWRAQALLDQAQPPAPAPPKPTPEPRNAGKSAPALN